MDKKHRITLDGHMNDPAWEQAQAFTDFRKLKSQGGETASAQTVFKVLPIEDRVYFGFLCMEPDIQHVMDTNPARNIWSRDRVELFFSPTGSSYDYYQFVVFFEGNKVAHYYAEGGQIRPDPFAPDWDSAVYAGEDYWSAVVEIPMTALYMTPNDSLCDKWLVGAIRCRMARNDTKCENSSCCTLERAFVEFEHYLRVSGMPLRPKEDDIRIISAAPDMRERCEQSYRGTMKIKTLNAVTDTFTFTSNYGDPAIVCLAAGANEFTVSCQFEALGRYRVLLTLTRNSDGKEFKRHYPVTVTYEPIKLRFTLPEYRCNFYPGQDYSKVVGTVTAAKPVTLKLEGPGIETQVLTPNADGSFAFDTPDFAVGEAWLTATMDGEEKKQKIRRLAPTGRMMTWISKGNLIVNGKPTLARRIYSPYYRGGEAFRLRYDNDNLHETRQIKGQAGWMKPEVILTRELKRADSEVMQDVMPSEDVLRMLDQRIEENKKRNFAFYYAFDEPECRGVSPIYVKHIYDYIADKDPYHVVLLTTRAAGHFVECADWFEVHPYIDPENMEDGRRVYMRPMNTMGNYIDDIAKLNRPDKCVGFIPMTFTYQFSSIYADYPTFEELLCHTLAAMIHGGKSLDPYAYHDVNDRAAIYEGVRYLFSSFTALEALVLHGKRTTLLRTGDAEAVLYDNGAEKMFVLVNFNQTPQTVTVDGLSGAWYEFRHNRTITGNTFALEPHAVVVGTNVVKDAGLPTYDQTKKLIDELEYARTHTGSLLFDRHNDMKITASGVGASSRFKMFDGVKDNLALQVAKAGERFYELDLTQVKPTFQKVIISGWQLDGIALKLRIGGQLVDAPLAEKKNQELSTVTFLLKESVCPEALRLEFTGPNGMELYEIEVF